MDELSAFCPKTEGVGLACVLVKLLGDNLPLSKKYPTAIAAKTNPIVMNLSHLESSMAAILPQTYNYCKRLLY